MKKVFYFSVIILVLLWAGLFFVENYEGAQLAKLWQGSNSQMSGSVREAALLPLASDKKITLMFVGDIMLNRRVGGLIQENKDYRWPFLKIASTTRAADILFGNLESVISDKGENVGSKYSFRALPRSFEGLKYAGFDVLNVANNHSADWSLLAFKDSLTRLVMADISFCGGGFTEMEAYGPTILTAAGVRFGFLCYTDLGPELFRASGDNAGFAWADWERIKQDIKKIKEQDSADIVIVSYHFGSEYETKPNARQKDLAEGAIDAGADLVVGHHSHVTQPVVRYKEGWIAYSLGNFVFDQMFSEATRTGILLEVKVNINAEIEQMVSHKIKINSQYQPQFLNK